MLKVNRLLWSSALGGLALVLSAQGALAATSGLYFSEYIEGSSNNKALEIYNGSGAPVDLSYYQVETYHNGRPLADGASFTIPLSSVVAQGGVYVLANASASADILAVANLPTGSLQVNGDDAIILRNILTGEIVDSFGQAGIDPGSAWNMNGVSTADMTLRRALTVTTGDVVPDDAFDPSIEWQAYPKDTFDDLGKYLSSGGTGTGGGTGDGSSSNVCGAPATLISTIQGDALVSPEVGKTHTVEGVVVGVFPGLKGFFIQEEDAQRDGNPLTSEGVFVYLNAVPTVRAGDVVRLTGEVVEYYDLTELKNVTLHDVCGAATVTPVQVQMPFAAASALESVEGMLVSFPQTLTVTDNYDLGRYGTVALSSNGRLYQPTHVVAPGVDALAVANANALNRILMDDSSSAQNPDPVIYPAPGLSAQNTLRTGDGVAGLVGIMNYGFGEYRIEPVLHPTIVQGNPRTPAPLRIMSGSMRVASFNVLNYFNGDGLGGGFPTSRGASTADEFTRQRTKILTAMAELDADIIGLMEIENDGYGPNSAIADLVNGLNAMPTRCAQYAFIDPGVAQIGSDEISTGLIYCADSVKPKKDTAILTSSIDPAFDDTKNRPALAQTFKQKRGDGEFTVVVNHLKSKGSDCNDAGDPDLGDGQGNCNLTRTSAARALTKWLATDPTHSQDKDFLIIGDLNAYAKEDPIMAIQSAGYTNLLARDLGDAAYSYVFMGASGNLDHALANSHLAGQVVAASVWHINADEPRALDYNLEFKTANQQITYYSPDAYRSSDHDAVVLDLMLTARKDQHQRDHDRHESHHDKNHHHGWLGNIMMSWGWMKR